MPDQLPDINVDGRLIPADKYSEQVHLLLLRELIDTNRATTAELKNVQASNMAIMQRLTLMEDKNLEARLIRAMERIDRLEDAAQQRAGAVKLVSWIKDYAPWIATMLGAIWLLFERKPPT